MPITTNQSELDIQRVLRAEIRDLQARHLVEINLIHAAYDMALNGPGAGLPTIDEQVALITGSALFDRDWYLSSNPDVAEGAVDPAIHYVCAGTFEGRRPGPEFDGMAYYYVNPDVAKAGWPALVHYLCHGKAEGRKLA